MNISTDTKRRQILWFAGLWCIGPVCMVLLDGLVRLLFFLLNLR